MLFALFNLNKVFLLYLLPNQPVRLDRILIYINLLQQDQAWYMSSGCSTRRKSSQSHSWSRSLSPTSPGAHSPPPPHCSCWYLSTAVNSQKTCQTHILSRSPLTAGFYPAYSFIPSLGPQLSRLTSKQTHLPPSTSPYRFLEGLILGHSAPFIYNNIGWVWVSFNVSI